MALLIFLPAWTLNYCQAWVFLLSFFGSSLAITLYLMKNDPKLLERRVEGGVGAEKEKSQKIIQGFAAIAFVATIVVPALDHRFRLSVVPALASLCGDMMVALGFFFVFRVFKENSYTSGIVEVAAEQKVISTGPYAVIRHPMYAGALILLLGVPLALGSWWGLLTIIPMTMVLAWRVRDEERFLAKNLAGYSEYRTKVKYRLVPFIW
jgi:protein-S-isoprenylcysteine O-methyltransferase Ste14